jgi:hypothetical protein
MSYRRGLINCCPYRGGQINSWSSITHANIGGTVGTLVFAFASFRVNFDLNFSTNQHQKNSNNIKMPIASPLGRRNSGFVPLDDIPHSNSMEWNEMSTLARSGKTISPLHPSPLQLRRPPPPIPNLVNNSSSSKPTFDLGSDPASSSAAFAAMDPENNPRNIQVLFHYEAPEKYPSWSDSQAKVPTEVPRPAPVHLSQAIAVHDDAASILTLSTIDGLAEHASEISHPCTITPMLPTIQSNYVTAPAATHQPAMRYPSLPDRPEPLNVMSRWLGRELLDMERQQELQVNQEQVAIKRVSPLFLTPFISAVRRRQVKHPDSKCNG